MNRSGLFDASVVLHAIISACHQRIIREYAKLVRR